MMRYSAKSLLFGLLGLLTMGSCQQESKMSFRAVDPEKSQLDFQNIIKEDDSLNYYNFPYMYMGAGVGLADLNNDGLQDIYITGNRVPNRLFINKGDLVFEDVTESSRTAGVLSKWYTGVTFVDVNLDGWQDIYLSAIDLGQGGGNELYVNNGDLTFTEQAAGYAIADSSNSIQSTFFDYDGDGDLDLFVANYAPVPLSRGPNFYKRLMDLNRWDFSGHLYEKKDEGFFEEVTAKAGLQNFGLTLGIVAADLNADGWSDLYLSNDFNVPDYLYLNNQDGTFREVSQEALPHTAMFGMGLDVADFTNDGWPDLLQVDMTPEDYVRAKVNMASMSPETFWTSVDLGLHYQYMQNTLHLHNGINSEGVPLFSDVAFIAGVATTDWSWAALFADFDNDGWKDAYITNGMKRDVNDNDLNQRTRPKTFQAAYGPRAITEYPSEPLANYLFRNKGNLTFEDVTEAWRLTNKTFSNGVAYGDLDNDGDLDLVVNNVDDNMLLYENRQQGNQYLRVSLQGPRLNPKGIGTKVFLTDLRQGKSQMVEQSIVRGYQSSVEPVIHFGVGAEVSQQLLKVVWPDRKEELRTITSFNTALTLDYKDASEPQPADRVDARFSSVSERVLDFVHAENEYDDYALEPLLPHRYSRLGPGAAVADINGDGLDDVFFGNGAGYPARLYQQSVTGTFTVVPGPWKEDAHQEDVEVVILDIDQDGDQDVYVVSGGYDVAWPQEHFQDRLYLNVRGTFVKSEGLPPMPISGKALAPADVDRDGDLDLFVGGRVSVGAYPRPTSSFILISNGLRDQDLAFEIHAGGTSWGFDELGMITDALWADLNADGWQDLVVTGEWQPVRVFMNDEGSLTERTSNWENEDQVGWWYNIHAMDVDNDGDTDLVAGNLGLNYKYKASEEKPFEVFLNDFDNNGRSDIVLGVHKEGRLLPLRGRECSSQQIPAIKAKYDTYRDFAAADLVEIYGEVMLERSTHYQATTFAHYWLENKGGSFEWHLLPQASQIAPVTEVLPIDYNGDEFEDLIVIGGLYEAEVETPRADASLGLVLVNNLGKGFDTVPTSSSGLMVRGNVKDLDSITISGQTYFLFTRNSGQPELITFDGSRNRPRVSSSAMLE